MVVAAEVAVAVSTDTNEKAVEGTRLEESLHNKLMTKDIRNRAQETTLSKV